MWDITPAVVPNTTHITLHARPNAHRTPQIALPITHVATCTRQDRAGQYAGCQPCPVATFAPARGAVGCVGCDGDTMASLHHSCLRVGSARPCEEVAADMPGQCRCAKASKPHGIGCSRFLFFCFFFWGGGGGI